MPEALFIRNGLEAALRIAADLKRFKSLIDVGSGGDHHKRFFQKFCDNVYTNDFDEKLEGQNYPGDFMQIKFDRKFQVVYASNVLEHSRNVGMFIEKLFSICEDDGYVAIMVPRPHLNKLLSGHITTWTTSTLIYNIVMCGFDCSQAKVCNGVYEKSVIVQKRPIPQKDPDFVYRSGVVDDVGKLAKFFPWAVSHKGRGILPSVRWPNTYTLPRTKKFDKLALSYLSGQTFEVKDGGTITIPQESIPVSQVGHI